MICSFTLNNNLPVCLSVLPPVCLSVCLSVLPPVCLSLCLSSLPADQRRGYSNVFNALARITREEGVTTMWRVST